MFIDAVGKTCPIPVMLAKKELDQGCRNLTVAVDNQVAVENLSRLAQSRGLLLTVAQKEGNYEVTMVSAGEEGEIKEQPSVIPDAETPLTAAACDTTGCGYAVFIGKDVVGQGERELGENLMKMAIYTLSQSELVPAAVLFMNSGVKLPAGEETQVIDSLKELTEKGTEVLVCGTCLNYYGLTEQLKVGKISNMYEILEKMQSAAKVITL